MNVQRPTALPGGSQMVLNVTNPKPQYSSSVPVTSSSAPLTSKDVQKLPPRSSSVVQRLNSNVVYAPIPSSSSGSTQRQAPNLLQQRLMGRQIRSPRIPKTKSYQKRRHIIPHRLEELRKALDLTKYIEQVQNLINQPIKIPSTVSTCMSKKTRKVPSKPKHDLLSIKDVWLNDQQRREELKSIFNTECVGEREFLLNLLLDDSDEDSASEENITEEDLQSMLRIHRKRRKFQNLYHKDPLFSQYTYYAAGLLSEHDKFTENQQNIRDQFLFMVDDFENK